MTLGTAWTDEEDELLRRLVAEYGPKKWSVIASKLKSKGSKQCRRRWKNCLNADLKKGGWTAEEDRILLEGHKLHGNKWTEIAKMVGGRTDNAVKNRWAAICKRVEKGGSRRQRGPSAAAAAAAAGGPAAHMASASSESSGSDDDSDDMAAHKLTPAPDHAPLSPRRSPRLTGGANGVTHAFPGPAITTGAKLACAAAQGAAATGLKRSRLGCSSLGLCEQQQQQAVSEQPLAKQPALQLAPDSMKPAAMRRLLRGSNPNSFTGSASGSGMAITPRTPRTPNLLSQVQEAATRQGTAGARQHHHLAPHAHHMPNHTHAHDASAAAAMKRPGHLTINIPNASGADPVPLASVPSNTIEIHVFKDLLTPCEIQYARELNEMQLPLHININSKGEEAPLDAGGPLSTSRWAAQNAAAALATPGSSGVSGDFADVLKWFQAGLTPRGGTGTMMGRTGLTPKGVGTGRRHSLSPNALTSNGNTPSSGGSPPSNGSTPGTRTRRQAAAAAAAAALHAQHAHADLHGSVPTGRTPSGVMSGLLSSGGGGGGSNGQELQLHAGHRQLLAKLINGAAADMEDVSDDPPMTGHQDLYVEGKALRLIPSSPTKADGGLRELHCHGMFSPGSLFTSRAGSATSQRGPDLRSGPSVSGISMTPLFTSSEIAMLLEALNGEDLRELPPPPGSTVC